MKRFLIFACVLAVVGCNMLDMGKTTIGKRNLQIEQMAGV